MIETHYVTEEVESPTGYNTTRIWRISWEGGKLIEHLRIGNIYDADLAKDFVDWLNERKVEG